ncbi:hypothetical protein CEXT_355491 [Caerostris extrusa]|uniref:Uncharacterized protein n=1 Tax=Caerostris extrusa TaxID=172846 RepID=A0AAV4RRQ7_CAEEX|nr:hypothetical protein CEXT_355491 [Caerostris extrusa]
MEFHGRGVTSMLAKTNLTKVVGWLMNNDTIRAYQDLEQKAAFSIVYRETGNFEMEGTVGNLIIKPIPGDIMIYDEEFNRNYENLPNSVKQSLSAAHIVIKIRIWPDLFGFDLSKLHYFFVIWIQFSLKPDVRHKLKSQ